jgi:bifunctional DNA-binding transcriptional regulator/antitoxin component of YhaV-PrlF toxin-antitoxin module
MRTSIDAAGRLVIPRALRERAGIVGPTDVDLQIDGVAIRVEALVGDGLIERDGLFMIPATGEPITDETIRELRLADQR